jgi:DNA modification methylase
MPELWPELVEQSSKSLKVNGKRANDLRGDAWLRNSISVWNDIRKDKEEAELSKSHPAIFPKMLVSRVLQSFTSSPEKKVLDPFMGSGSTILAAVREGKFGIGFDVYHKYIKLAEDRLRQTDAFSKGSNRANYQLIEDDASRIPTHLKKNSIDIVITSPPYWDILNQRRTADYKESKQYGNKSHDLANIHDYGKFIDSLAQIFQGIYDVLKPGKYCIVNVMDLRKKNRFFPYHSDLARRMEEVGYIFDDLIIWDRRSEYNNLRPLGFPSVFRINKIHEYLLILLKPKSTSN